MAKPEPLITYDKLKSNIMDRSLGKKPHKVYVVYDNLMDELIIKLTPPERLVVEFPVDDSYSVLVDPSDLEVVGFQIAEFVAQYLARNPRIAKIWKKFDLAKEFDRYQEIDYMPEDDDQGQYFFIPPQKVERILAAC